MINSMSFSLPAEVAEALDVAIEEWTASRKIERLWRKDAAVWTDTDESKWLGWLDIVDEELADLDKYRKFSEGIGSAGFRNVLLMGMGGSSLCPEVFETTFGKSNFHVLDSTVPARIKAIEKRLDLAKT